jgi:hypothetical protein
VVVTVALLGLSGAVVDGTDLRVAGNSSPRRYDAPMGDEERRQAALATMTQRFPAVAERVRRGYGLRLPRHVAVFCALWHSADDAERAGLAELEVSPFGLTEYFADGGLDLVGRDGLDERLQGRFRRDPAEFVTVLMGGSDGLHYGLWYDDPAELPSFVVHNYARDSAETWTSRSPTLLAELRRVVDDALSYDEEAELGALVAALDWFAVADAAAVAADGPPRWADAARPDPWLSVFPALPPGSGDPCLAELDARLTAFAKAGPSAARWIARAGDELAQGRPALALAVGGELHWLDADAYRVAGLDLLVGAYRQLGRDALAGIAEVHAANRDLPDVDVLVAPDQGC